MDGLGLGFGVADWPIVLLVLLYSPFLVLDIAGVILGGGLWGARLFIYVCKLPWREITKSARASAPNAILLYRVASLLHHLLRFMGGGRKERN